MKPILALATLAIPAALAQAPATPAFDVAEIKPAANGAARGKPNITGGRFEMPGANLIDLIRFAYSVPEDMIAGAPKWAFDDRYDVVAKAAGHVPASTLALMMQDLLADRFKLAIRREEKPAPAYVLSLGTRPAKYRQAAGGRQTCKWTTLESGRSRRTCENMTMAELARQLPGWGGIGIDLPVVDQTGLSGAYDFEFDVGMRRTPKDARTGGGKPAASSLLPDSGPNIFVGLELIGLKLERRKMPLQGIVIERAERP